MRRNVLVIGKHSYIGRNFISYCNENNKQDEMIHIHAISGKNKEYEKEDFSRYDCVILLSGIVHVKADSQLYYEINNKMAVDIAKKAKLSNVKHFIFLSTIAVLGERLDNKTNIDKPMPCNDYAKSKCLAEESIMSLNSSEFLVTVVRPPMVYGKGCPGNFSRLVKLIEHVHCFPNVKNERSAIYITNLCSFLYQIVYRPMSGVFVPQNSEYLSSLDIAIIISKKKRIILLKGIRWIIYGMMPVIKPISKMFGNYRYPLDLSHFDDFNYQRVSTKESIEKSLE